MSEGYERLVGCYLKRSTFSNNNFLKKQLILTHRHTFQVREELKRKTEIFKKCLACDRTAACSWTSFLWLKLNRKCVFVIHQHHLLDSAENAVWKLQYIPLLCLATCSAEQREQLGFLLFQDISHFVLFLERFPLVKPWDFCIKSPSFIQQKVLYDKCRNRILV